ncbi:condensation domain-containing protein [Streptomyces sp. P17]|uniref:condensation domain-containing protein n=1 Tax=Streptomyces sp. P17 TaxID=3074716 RepID=UPI0028F451D5|nr:condensation domain-containing protein [Streptomyces sp. P17]MDT9701427.1 condensation domain-containing protein [Streptomyces sp. P17]
MTLSVGQEGLWLTHQLAPDSPAYNVVLAVRLRDRVDTGRLQRALTALATRHELLRSRFPAGEEGPVRVTVPAEAVRLDVREVPGAGDEELFRLAHRAGQEPFRLAEQVAFRAVLLRRAEDDAVLVTVTHHIVSDATSQWLLVRDLFAAYEDAPQPASVDWDQRVLEERAFIDSPRGRRAAGHWRGVCAGLGPAELPADRPRPAERTLNGATVELDVSAATADRLREAAARHALTPFAWLLGTFQAALHRLGAGDGFLIGCPATTRFTPQSRQAVGYYVNALPMAARFTPDTTLLSAVQDAQSQLRTGLAHARYPVELLDSTGPLFRISCTLVAADRLPVPGLYEGPVLLGGLRAELCDVPQQEGQLDLTAEVLQGGRDFRAVLRYNTDLFDAATIERFRDTWLRLLEASLDTPDTRAAEVSLAAADDLTFLLALGAGAP